MLNQAVVAGLLVCGEEDGENELSIVELEGIKL